MDGGTMKFIKKRKKKLGLCERPRRGLRERKWKEQEEIQWRKKKDNNSGNSGT